MLSKFEIAIIVLLVVNVLATIYFNYRMQEDYANYSRENNALQCNDSRGRPLQLHQCVNSTLQNQYNQPGLKKGDWDDRRMGGAPSSVIGYRAPWPLWEPLKVINSAGKVQENRWGMCVQQRCAGPCAQGQGPCKNCVDKNCTNY